MADIVEALTAPPSARLLGGYLWQAYGAAGQHWAQFDAAGQEHSVEELRDQPVIAFELVPLPGRPHARVCLRVQPGEGWIKHWSRAVTVDAVSGAPVGETCLDVLGLRLAGGDEIRLFIYQDGSVLVSTEAEP